ncbi:MAG: protein translocase subunit SecD [Gemmatimonadetes bacterium]|nr:protein translocase subunit SecD [Gemmatimonadota bacterium]MBK6778902.1 protein translocase subunit SecD [Gemmatimonadota bacterium]MBK7714352.1 protein translocase subunit SecD [Gemmatimonadota bacterium]MBK7924356.1 protein translocase subunit SecD [Gemmatimonadota bacterium]MBK9691398.1 protein translocase subunit SecD [Gemmatimonadota bacterium]
MIVTNLRTRLGLIAAMLIASAVSLIPREVTQRERGADGIIRDTVVKRVPLKRGLDLQGGMHLGLELDQSKRVSADPVRDIDLALTVLRKRIDEFGVTEPLIQKQGEDRIVVELAGITEPARAKAIVQKSAFLEFRITDRSQALDKALPAMDRALQRLGVQAVAGAAAPATAVTQLLQGDSAQPEAAADTAPVTGGALSTLVLAGSSAGYELTPGEYLVEEGAVARADSLLNLPDVRTLFPRRYEFRWAAQAVSVGAKSFRSLYVLEDRPIVTGTNLVDAKEDIDPLTSGPIVTFELDRKGARDFGEGTGKNVGNYMAIILDDRVQGRPPVIQERIERRGQITLAGKSFQDARDLALTLRAGALPVPLKIVEEFQVGASLGEDSINSGLLAGLVGTALVVLIMLVVYRMSGALAVAGLACYILLSFGALAMIGATLTLPGLAGLILSIGIAVDANVLIFERIREELALGKTVRLSIEEGFKHAMNAIVDSNVTTVMTALFLFQFGTGPVKGFAVTLTIGIICSMITAVFVTRTFYMVWLDRKPAMATLSI